MLPRTTMEEGLPPEVVDFAQALGQSPHFSGEVACDAAQRITHSLDNGIYELMPQAVIYPRTEEDICIALQLIKKPAFRSLSITAKGGGTSTNGQCLSFSLILDTSRYMKQVLSLDLKKKEVKVQGGVVLDTLQHYLRPHGYHFAPTTSSSSRVTLGGMIATDAAGIGSRVHGKTSDHLSEVRVVLWGGEVWDMKKERAQKKAPATDSTPSEDVLHFPTLPSQFRQRAQRLAQLCRQHQGLIRSLLPQIPRSWSGYNLAGLFKKEEQRILLDLPRLIAGSEGTLGVISECTLRITPILKAEAVVVLYFSDLIACTKAGAWVLEGGAQAVELLDHQLIGAARRAGLWPKDLTSGDASATAPSVHGESCQLAQFAAASQQQLDEMLLDFQQKLKEQGQKYGVQSYKVGRTAKEIKSLWDIRKKSVPLFAGDQRLRTPYLKSSAFVEDVAVHPRDLPAFIQEFRTILDSHHLTYGLYGHLDAGCLHVRPKLDYRDPELISTIRTISQQVFELTRRYGGVLWGEHGKGLRSQYLAEFLGPQLHEAFREIKALFDPHNQLNPGKICTPLNSAEDVLPLDAAPLRAHTEQKLQEPWQQAFSSALACDGNGLCFREGPEEVMCPSYRATADRLHSPKGRAAALRWWIARISSSKLQEKDSARLLDYALAGSSMTWRERWRLRAARLMRLPASAFRSPGTKAAEDFSHELYWTLEGCLSCGACTTSCPLQVDVPLLKSRFLATYHLKYPRRLQDYCIAWSERILPALAQNRWLRMLYHFSLRPKALRHITSLVTGMQDLPHLSQPAKNVASSQSPRFSDSASTQPQALLLGDLITEALDGPLKSDINHFLGMLHVPLRWLPYKPSGKSWHLRGWLPQSKKVMEKRCRQMLEALQQAPQAALVAVDPAFAFFYQQEYIATFPELSSTTILTLQEFLLSLPQEPWLNLKKQITPQDQDIVLLQHCQESAHSVDHGLLWQQVFTRFGLTLRIESVGCCGLAGFWGHQSNNVLTSQEIFRCHWKPPLEDLALKQAKATAVLVTGGSCRKQIQRLYPQIPLTIQHPLSYLRELLAATAT